MLGPVAAFCVVVGSVIGSGIFLVPAKIATDVPFMSGIIMVWVIGGLFSGAGALTLAELGAMLPRAGGLYVYLRVAYGALAGIPVRLGRVPDRPIGFDGDPGRGLRPVISRGLVPPALIRNEVWQAGAATLAIAVVTAVNVLGTRRGGTLQVVGTILKVGGVMISDRATVSARGRTRSQPHPDVAEHRGRIDLHRDDGRDGQRALGVRRLDQRHAARGRDP